MKSDPGRGNSVAANTRHPGAVLSELLRDTVAVIVSSITVGQSLQYILGALVGRLEQVPPAILLTPTHNTRCTVLENRKHICECRETLG